MTTEIEIQKRPTTDDDFKTCSEVTIRNFTLNSEELRRDFQLLFINDSSPSRAAFVTMGPDSGKPLFQILTRNGHPPVNGETKADDTPVLFPKDSLTILNHARTRQVIITYHLPVRRSTPIDS